MLHPNSNLFRTVPSDELLVPVLVTVMRYYGWRQLSILTEGEPQFTMVHSYSMINRLINWTYNFLSTFPTIYVSCSFFNSRFVLCLLLRKSLRLTIFRVFSVYYINVYAVVWTSLVFIEVCIFLGLTFIPKVSYTMFETVYLATLYATIYRYKSITNC